MKITVKINCFRVTQESARNEGSEDERDEGEEEEEEDERRDTQEITALCIWVSANSV